MKELVIVFFTTAAVCSGADWDTFQVTYGRPGFGYYNMPWSVQEATASRKWLKIDEDDLLNMDVYAQPEDPRLLLYFDKNENIAGISMGFLKEDIRKKADEGGHSFDFDYDNNPMYAKARYFGKDIYYCTALFQNPVLFVSNPNHPHPLPNVYYEPEWHMNLHLKQKNKLGMRRNISNYFWLNERFI